MIGVVLLIGDGIGYWAASPEPTAVANEIPAAIKTPEPDRTPKTNPNTSPVTQSPSETPSAESTAAPGLIASAMAPGRCLDIAAAATSGGTGLVLWDCHGESNQRFDYRTKTGEIRAYNGAMCLDAGGGSGADGDRIIIWPCHGGANQKWKFTASGEIRGINDKCMDASGASPANGTPLILWQCHGGTNQKWSRR